MQSISMVLFQYWQSKKPSMQV